MRIWLAPSAFYPASGGVEELTLQLAREYQRRGHAVVVVVHHHPRDLVSRETVEGVPVVRLPFALPGRELGPLLTYPLTLAAQVRALSGLQPKPDLIHVQCASNQVLPIAVFARAKRIPLVITTQGEVAMDAHRIYQRSVQQRLSLRFASWSAGTLTACSRRAGDDAALVARRFRDSVVVPNGVDPDQWTMTPVPSTPAYAAWGRHVRQKGFDLLLRAFTLVREELPSARLRVGGDGPETPALKAVAGDGVEFWGPLSREGVQGLLDVTRVVVVPSRFEPFGIVAVEAMATGRGVVWSTNGGLADATGGLGWGVDPNDVRALATAMIEAHRSPLDSSKARQHAVRHSWKRISDVYEDLYDELIGRSAVTAPSFKACGRGGPRWT